MPASGTVTYKGKPLGDAWLTFLPSEAGKAAGMKAKTDSSGTFKLKSGGLEGAIPGKYKVIVSKKVYTGGKLPEPVGVVPPGETEIERPGGKELLPDRYSNLVKTELTTNVPSGGGNLKIELK